MGRGQGSSRSNKGGGGVEVLLAVPEEKAH